MIKTAKAKSAPPAVQRKAGKPFFGKGGDPFFGRETSQPGFFMGAAGHDTSAKEAKPLQAKLTIGKPNDPYEREADAMADKVVQRLATSEVKPDEEKKVRTKKDGPLLRTKPMVQEKCKACEADEAHAAKQEEDKIQKKENKLAAEEATWQRRTNAETIPDPAIQKKAAAKEAGAPVSKANSPVASNTAGGNTIVQTKCAACEQEEKQKQEEEGPELLRKVQRKPIFESNAQLPEQENSVQRKCAACEQEESSLISRKPLPGITTQASGHTIQRACRECEEGNAILMKPEAAIQRAVYDQTPNNDGSRESILAAAKGEIGKVEAAVNDGTGRRVGSDRLLEYFHIAAPGVWDDHIIETAGANMPSWCGIFSVWAHKKAGKDVGNWQMGKGVSAFGTLTATDTPQPGDIGYINMPNQHHAIVKEVAGDKIITIDGNSGVNKEVKENTKPRSKYTGFLTAFGSGGGNNGNVQAKEDDVASIQAKASENATAPPSVESRINSTKGGGAALPDNTRQQMEQSFGADFGNVRVHTDSTAVQLSKDLNAQAFTHGSDIYFNSGKYDSGTSAGQHLLAHELTHVVQQGSAQPQNRVNRAAEEDQPNVPDGNEEMPDEASIEEEAMEDMQHDDYGGPAELTPQEQQEAESDGYPSEGEMDMEDEGAEEGAGDDAAQPEPAPAEGGDEQEEGDSVPDGTPAEGPHDEECPKIVPEYPSLPENQHIDEEEESFYEELIGIAGRVVTSGPASLITRALGVGAYYAWRHLPMAIKIRVINFVLDNAISGAYWGRILGNFNIGMLSAALTGFFKRMRKMSDQQKVVMFEKFGRIILRGDIYFILGMLKGVLMGFFLDGLLGIIQMVIDLICLVPRILNFFAGIKNFLDQLPYEVELIKNSIAEMMASVGDLVSNAVDELKAFVREPRRMLNILQTIYNAAAGAAEKVGEAMADALIRFAALPPATMGEISGRIAGQILFEALLIYFTAGGGAAVTAAKQTLRAIGRGIATIGRQIFELVKQLGRVLKFIRGTIGRIRAFLTPILRMVADKARLVIDRLAALFRVFRRSCRPGSVKCDLPKPKCRGRYVPRLGGHAGHDAYVTRTTRQTRDFRLRGTLFGLPLSCTYDAKVGRMLIEGKTGHRSLPFLQRTRPDLYRLMMFRLNEQRWRCTAIAARCGFLYVWYMQEKTAADYLAYRWHGMPPVLYRP